MTITTRPASKVFKFSEAELIQALVAYLESAGEHIPGYGIKMFVRGLDLRSLLKNSIELVVEND